MRLGTAMCCISQARNSPRSICLRLSLSLRFLAFPLGLLTIHFLLSLLLIFELLVLLLLRVLLLSE